MLAMILAAAGVAGYVGYAALRGHTGFPLDDAWIHQTYARNLVQFGAWEYVPGQPSAGSTSPLWTLLLTIGYAIRVNYRIWALLLGALSAGLVAWAAAALARQMFKGTKVAWLVALASALEWHMLWAGASGMETALFTALCLSVLALGLRVALEDSLWLWGAWGLAGGLAFLTRPEGVLPLAMTGVAVVIARRANLRRSALPSESKRYGLAVAACLAVAVPYLALNWSISGVLLPNTFYAKQAEYGELLAAIPFLSRVARVAGVQFVGGQAILIPGLIAGLIEVVRHKRWLGLLPMLWWLAVVLLYALRLPVTYQHGRYEMPTVPVLLVYGVPGTVLLLSRASTAVQRVLARATAASAALVLLAFVGVGAQTYLTDVRIIDSEMVEVAHWLDANTPPDAVIAVHDIGAVGYFTQRRLLDLAGLVSPEVVPFIRDEGRLEEYMRDRGASYLVTFPGWYPTLTAGKEIVFQTDSPWSVKAGGENMAVYRLSFDGQ
jgi:arabinofuranosyltransferase